MKIERQLQGTLNTVFTELVKEKGLGNKIQAYSAQEENRADITLKKSNGKPIFFVELKDPTAKDGRSVFDSGVLMREVERAQRLDIKYFGNCNFLACAFFDRDKLFEKVSVNEGFFSIHDIFQLSNNYSPNKDIETKLRAVANFYIDRALEIIEKKSISFSPPDELFIFKIRKLIEVYANTMSTKVWEIYQTDKKFENKVLVYTQSQMWNRPSTFEEIENLTHIAILMLISKLIFYKAYVDNQTWHKLSPMSVTEDIETSLDLEIIIWKYFEEFKEITGDFELLIGDRADIIFQIPFVSDSVIDLVKDVLDTGGHYNFSEIQFDIIGHIFEELIREDERHKLGQYFTPSQVVDLINSFAIRSEQDKVFDPSCGSGTFLVRAYEKKKQLSIFNSGKPKDHKALLNEIYGNDLSGYPAYLSMLNLAIRNTLNASYPLIICKDFFSISERSMIELHNDEGEKVRRILPKFDAIIGNPPYTRQEDIGAMHGTVNKSKINGIVRAECGFNPSQRTSIYAYFFYHATVFLKDRGYLVYICQNSWLETDYGVDLQRYLLRNFEIVAIMDSEVERFFPTASVNTTIVVLKRQLDEKLRDSSITKFVLFRRPLLDVIKYYGNSDNLKEIINNTIENLSDEFFRINCVRQDSLIGYSKWTQFLKAPDVYIDILKKGEGSWKTLSGKNGVAIVKRGITTGCNDFFLVRDITDVSKDTHVQTAINRREFISTLEEIKRQGLRIVVNGFKEHWLIEKRFLEPILTSPKDLNTYLVNPTEVQYYVLLVEEEKSELYKNYPFVSEYIRNAERNNIHHRSTLKSRKPWYSIGERQLPNMSFSYMINDFGKTYMGKVLTNDNFQNLFVKKKKQTLFLFMNSTISWLFQQIIIRTNFGDGVAKIQSYELSDLFVPTIDLEDLKVNLGRTNNYKDELGDLDSLSTVNPERLKLDNAILNAIGYTKKEEREETLLNLYRATFQLIDARLHKAQSQKSIKSQRNKIEFKVYVDLLKDLLLERKYIAKNTLTYAHQLQKLVQEITSENKLQIRILDTYWKEKYGKVFNEKQIAQQDQLKIF